MSQLCATPHSMTDEMTQITAPHISSNQWNQSCVANRTKTHSINDLTGHYTQIAFVFSDTLLYRHSADMQQFNHGLRLVVISEQRVVFNRKMGQKTNYFLSNAMHDCHWTEYKIAWAKPKKI